ncbi:Phosphopantetheine adenylyltransferase [Thermodesulfobacterium geofontis OPF15]|jgi:pantetheine-phosphate adenylyltransferase|uniref:Phosphopantetheine adenylyltransferase n=2 Tax=Thermodesulfobacterium geofontis TaxID=1295609 RepID=F8C1W8_THEGP|nr:pantetheine-phosphate adenylyltransferase [Thermodesulfobacterium geofontis]AEH23294.1 Phosphopantetheine adenylyltransferase [Thermodesulfobacterium geofontis OPF15]
MENKKIGIYPGTFDPITNGHLDIIKRALKLFDLVIVAVGENPQKQALFSLEERVYLIKEAIKELPENHRIEVEAFSGLLVEFAKKKSACAIIRGLRAVSDFEYEMQIALMNRKLSNSIDTVFLLTSLKWIFLSSSIVKEVAKLGGNVDDLVPKIVAEKLKEKFR